MINLQDPEIKFAVNAVRQASQLIQVVQAEMVSPALTKDDRSPVTVADFASQAIVGQRLMTLFPGERMVAEEDAQALQKRPEILGQVSEYIRQLIPAATPEQVCNWIDYGRVDRAERFWTLDPIDGTKGFLRGDQYAVALARVVKGQVQIGVMGCPNLVDGYRPDLEGEGSLVVAIRGQGTWVSSLAVASEFTRLTVSARRNPREARILRSFEAGHTNVSQIDVFSEQLGVGAEPVRMDSQAKYAVLAAGKGDILLRLLSASQPDYREKIWDQAAGSLVLEEAGGRITDLSGMPLDFTTGRTLENNHGVLASNGWLHEPALQVLHNLGA